MRIRTVLGGRQGRRLLTAVATAGLISGTMFVSSVALASTPANLFELEGNAATTHAGTGAPDDWDRVCHQVLGSDCSTANDTNGATAVAWAPDTHGAIGALNACTGTNCTIFTGGGSKDPIDINQWAWKDNVGGLPDKDNLLHGYAARYSIPSSTACPAKNPDGSANTDGTLKCDMLFFGNDRFDNSGDAQQGFWFFQNKIGLGSNAVGGGNGFSSSADPEFHRNGDLLLLSDFSIGGTVSTITVYTWDTGCTKTDIPKTGPVSGVSCGDANLRFQATSTNANCNPADPAISGFCGIVNPGTITMPWTFQDKSHTAGNGALNGEFYEGGINLSSLNLGAECFAAIASETRSSTSTTATLKDFVLGSFGNCSSRLETTPKDGSGNSLTDSDGNGLGDVSIGTGSVTAKDSAALTISGVQSWSGTLKFFICGPIASGECTTGGPQIGSTITVTNNTQQPIVSGAATLTSAGRYCWRGVFTHTTNGVPDATDSTSGECFEVLPVTPTLSTSAGADVTLGSAISDTATLTGTATGPGSNGPDSTYPTINPTTPGAPAGGTISFVADGANSCTDSGLTVSGSPVTVSGDKNGTPASNVYGPVTATPTATTGVGKYVFIATYSGDSPNTNGAGPTLCTDANEDVLVGSSSTATTPKTGDGGTISTDANSNGVPDLSIGTGSVTASDHAVVTVTGISTWSGSVQFYICGPLALTPLTSNCASGGDAIGSAVAVSSATTNTADAPSTTFTRAGSRYCWRAEFTSSTTGVPNSSDGSTTECFEVLPVTPTLVTSAGPDVTLGSAITDTATLTGTANQPGSGGKGTDGSINPTTPGAVAGGTITWVVKKGAACTDSGLAVTPALGVTVSGDRDGVPASDVYGPASATPTTLGTYTFVATYTGNSPNTNGAGPGACPNSAEEVVVNGNASFSTAQNWLPNDTATLQGDANLNGTLTFKLYNDGTCGQSGGTVVFQPATATTVTNAAPGTSFSTSNTTVKVTASGTYSWLVSYDDNVLNDPAPSCTEVTSLTIANN